MEKKIEIDISQKWLDTDFSSLESYKLTDSIQTFNSIDDFFILGKEIDEMQLELKNNKLWNIKLKSYHDYESNLKEFYKNLGTPKIFINEKTFSKEYKDNNMSWKQGIIKQKDFDENKLMEYSIIGWVKQKTIIIVHKPFNPPKNRDYTLIEIKNQNSI